MQKYRGALCLIRGMLVAYLITGMLIFILAWVTYKLDLSDNMIGVFVTVIYILSNVAGGFSIARCKGRKRLLYGLLSGALYVAILFLISVIATKGISNIEAEGVAAILLCLGGGALGGIIS